MHSFSIEKPRNISATLAQVSLLIQDSGGSFNGDNKDGRFSGSGVEGKYTVGERIKITILNKPFFYPNSAVEQRIRDYFRGR